MLHNTPQQLLIANVTYSINNFMISCPIKPAILFQRPAQFFVFCKDTITFWPRLKAYIYNDTVFSVNMMTSTNRNIFRVTGHLCGEFIGHRWIPRTKASDAELWRFFDLRPYKLSKQSRGWWFETPSCPLWHHSNELHVLWSKCYNR